MQITLIVIQRMSQALIPEVENPVEKLVICRYCENDMEPSEEHRCSKKGRKQTVPELVLPHWLTEITELTHRTDDTESFDSSEGESDKENDVNFINTQHK